ncbi:MAG: SDR family NAD(P)-dependent oxidoreductase [Methanothrix sp.]|nr:SDR family NAD(P)-dependent oxidoreductase [Methanothrix sp.]
MSMSIGRFDGKTIVVTGGGSGIGLQTAKDLHAEGAYVHILGRNADKLASAKMALGDGTRSYVHQCDVSREEAVEETFQSIEDLSGKVYGLVNNAAINPSRNDILHTQGKDWRDTLEVNLTGAFNCCKAAASQMLDLGKGSIVNISSVGGLNAFRTRTSYNVSKFGLIGLTESMAIDYADRNIRVNAICPGYVMTELTAPLFEKMGEEKFQDLVRAHAMRRLGRPEEISRAILFLLSEEAGFITGVALQVDGGYHLKG